MFWLFQTLFQKYFSIESVYVCVYQFVCHCHDFAFHSSPSHPSPAELAEMLSELRRVEERLQPFIQRAHSILETASTAEYNNNTVGFILYSNAC